VIEEHLELIVWTAGSILLAVAAAQLAWVGARSPTSGLGHWRAALTHKPLGQSALFLARLVFYIGLPYLTLLRHSLSLVSIGMLGTETPDLPWWLLGWNLSDWSTAVGWTAALGGMTAAALSLGWRNVRRAVGPDFSASGLVPAPSLLVIVRESILAETHWAFYRAAPLALIADPYWATLTGAALVIFEWLLNPNWHFALADGPQREQWLMQLVWLALSATLFALTKNIWPILAAHILLEWSVSRWAALLSTQATVAPSP